jgi:predicted ATPase/class 3 adenylate cyclase
MTPMSALPTGTVTFVFTDLEGSTKLADQLGPAYADVLAEHRRAVRELVAAEGGQEFGTEGDAFFLVFGSAPAAVRAAALIQRRTAEGAPKVRVGIHTGEGVAHEGGYVGLDLHRVARITAAGHGGQVLLSEAALGLVADELPPGVSTKDLGEHRLKDLRRPEHLFQLVIEGLPADFPPLRGTESEAGNIPAQLTSFVGRERELEELTALVEDSSLVTLTGPGGTGKTRLAIALAMTTRDRYPGGAWFVPLSTVTDPAMVAVAVGEALGLTDLQGPGMTAIDRVIRHVAPRRVLLILDNFEQVLGGAETAARIASAAPMARVVATSRSALRVYGEREYQVPPLGLPDPSHLPDLGSLSQFEAVRLFVDRATAVRPGFEVTTENAPAVAEITARLDGLPLAIELAAARTRVLTPDQILARMGDRLALLSGGSRDLPARQQTLRQAIAWSYDLLEEPERKLFTRLAVFSGGWTLEEAEPVCGPPAELGMDVLDGLDSLAEKSLLRIRDVGGASRFAMLATIREFAVELLAADPDVEAVRRRHAETFLALAERAASTTKGADQRAWLDRLEPEQDNLRAALEWAIGAGEAVIALRLVSALWRFWQMRGHLQEGRGWADRAVSMPGAEAHPVELAQGDEAAGSLAYWQGDMAAMTARYAHALELAEAVGDPKLLADSLYNYGYTFDMQDMESSGQRLMPVLERALGIYETLGDLTGMAKVRWTIANYEYARRDYAKATELGRQSVEEARAVGNDFQLGWSLFMLGASLVHLRADPLDEARQDLLESLRTFRDSGDLTGILFNLVQLSELFLLTGEAERGVRVGAFADSLLAETGAGLAASERLASEHPEHGLPPEDFAVAVAQGEGLMLAEAVAYALGEADPFDRSRAAADPVPQAG